ncbi:hypothetical protein F503_01548 [Ophiostoma piceae UAMH 11346]|uniref:Uncharacterized protein n=1 Tax=Ophiostoma piceae (strain UAMH 11346) TaxID=1262450 RepID=S3BQY9_OPHP1|nr:hypothetical protein F503_01548 [Ophiostoma piceae UAMH 11346]
MREALAAARKLYALPEMPITEWLATTLRKSSTTPPPLHDPATPRRNSALVIYEALPLLVAGPGKDNSSPFFITKGDAAVMADEILKALTLRLTKGRQSELAEEKAEWQELLHRLSAAA